MTSSVGPSFSFFQNVLVREMMKSYPPLGLVIRLNFSYLHLSFIIRWNVNCKRFRISLFISRFCCVFLCKTVSESAFTRSFDFVHAETCE